MIDIVRYDKSREAVWNAFVAQSKNATFLHHRSYMDYHSDRFEDFSLMFYNKGRLIALLPANKEGDTLCSHRGLTFGGLLLDLHSTAAETCALVHDMNLYLSFCGFKTVIYRAIPHIYHTLPAEEDLYPLFSVCNARLVGRDIASTLILPSPIRWERVRRRALRRAQEAGLEIRKSEDFAAFWKVLDDNLMSCHGVHPVHTLDEITLLKNRFPNNIQLFEASLGGEVVAGMVMYLTPQVAHAQYSSATPYGKQIGALDFIYNHLLNTEYVGKHRYFDIGRSTENQGHYLNEDLIFQKEGFGGRGICYDTYEYTLS